MTSHVKQLVLLSLLNIAAVVSKVSLSLKTTRHEAFLFWYHINKIHKQRSTSFTAWHTAVCGIVAVQLWQTVMGCMRDWHTAVCGICSFSVVANRLSWAASQTGIQLCVATVAVQLWQTDRTCDSPEMRKIFQLQYGAVNRSPSQQMCECLATADIAVCLYAVQQCGCKIILMERK